jgi:hypothetical protein
MSRKIEVSLLELGVVIEGQTIADAVKEVVNHGEAG